MGLIVFADRGWKTGHLELIWETNFNFRIADNPLEIALPPLLS